MKKTLIASAALATLLISPALANNYGHPQQRGAYIEQPQTVRGARAEVLPGEGLMPLFAGPSGNQFATDPDPRIRAHLFQEQFQDRW